MGSCAAPSAKGDDKFITTDYLQQCLLTIVVQIPRNADRLRANPLGIYVNAINWSRELGQ
ncbi:VirB8/TrbF family protein [Pantoea brenneri]|jgi:type IV secretory pathway TrbF-like protein|uniref:VirB8/TrbF family protein n=1 Tax=Pantoea brenneri TaxID=472694 RepID=UPI000B081153